jgi:3-oxoadipate enol-lactonase/4-carboxymuconolactone decarboxylase
MFVRTGDITAHVQIDGPPGATPLLLIHSLGTTSDVWEPQTDSLARSFRVIRPDLRGHGLTELTEGPYSIDQLAQDMLALLDALGVAKAHVGGLSIGGLVAQAMASLAPERVASLILCDTAMAIPPAQNWLDRAAAVRASGMAPIAETVLARWVTPAFASSAEAAGLRTMLLRTPAEGYAAAAEAIAAADLTARTRALTHPTLVLVGDQDQATPLASAEALRDAIAGAKLVVITGGAHIPNAEQAAQVTAAITEFLTPKVEDYYEAGMQVRRQVLGNAHVDRATAGITDFDRAFQHFITRTAWGSVWHSPALDRRTRSLLTLAMMASLGHHEEFKLHIRASRNTGATPADIAEMLVQVAVYAGVPAANSAVRIAKETYKEMDAAS